MVKVVLLSLGFGLLLTACGSDDGGGAATGKLMCEPFVPCGGVITGKWRLNNTCPSAASKAALESALAVCDQGSATLVDFKVDGSATVDAQSVIIDGALSISVASVFPRSCVPNLTSCDQFETALAKQDSVTEASCTSMAESCSCTYRQSISIKRQSSIVINGSTVTETDPADGSMETSEFCVEGNTLRMSSAGSIDVYTR